MDIVDIKDEFNNSKILLVLLGALLIPVTYSIDSILSELYKIFGLSFKNLLILSISFHGLIIACLLTLLYWIIAKPKSGQPKIALSIKSLTRWGIISFVILVSGAALRVYTKLYSDNTPDISRFDKEGLSISDLAYLVLTQLGLETLRNLLLFLIYFAIIFRSRTKCTI